MYPSLFFNPPPIGFSIQKFDVAPNKNRSNQQSKPEKPTCFAGMTKLLQVCFPTIVFFQPKNPADFNGDFWQGVACYVSAAFARRRGTSDVWVLLVAGPKIHTNVPLKETRPYFFGGNLELGVLGPLDSHEKEGWLIAWLVVFTFADCHWSSLVGPQNLDALGQVIFFGSSNLVGNPHW